MKIPALSELVRCPRCLRHLDPLCFYKDRSKASGRKSHCRACSKEACSKWKRSNPEKVAAYAKQQRHLNRNFRLANRFLDDPSNASGDERELQQVIELFGPDFKSQGIHLTSKYSMRPLNDVKTPAEEFAELFDLLHDRFERHFANQYEMVNSALMLRLVNLLFPLN